MLPLKYWLSKSKQMLWKGFLSDPERKANFKKLRCPRAFSSLKGGSLSYLPELSLSGIISLCSQYLLHLLDFRFEEGPSKTVFSGFICIVVWKPPGPKSVCKQVLEYLKLKPGTPLRAVTLSLCVLDSEARLRKASGSD